MTIQENKIRSAFNKEDKKILNIYFTAGYPNLNDTQTIIKELTDAKVDIIELGVPYSDPLADGLTIQESSQKALENGISLKKVFDQVEDLDAEIETPMVMMGYFNQFLQFGIDNFIHRLNKAGISGVIIPDLPLDYYQQNFQEKFEKANISISFLITPETPEERIRQADELATGFLYVVAQSSITGGVNNVSESQNNYFKRIKDMGLKSPKLIGFGIHDNKTFSNACRFAEGAIIGSAFIRDLKKNGTQNIQKFVETVRS